MKKGRDLLLHLILLVLFAETLLAFLYALVSMSLGCKPADWQNERQRLVELLSWLKEIPLLNLGPYLRV